MEESLSLNSSKSLGLERQDDIDDIGCGAPGEGCGINAEEIGLDIGLILRNEAK